LECGAFPPLSFVFLVRSAASTYFGFSLWSAASIAALQREKERGPSELAASRSERKGERIMTPVERLFEMVLALPPKSRAALAKKLIASLPEMGAVEADALWAAEAEKRIAAFERGEMKTIPAEEVMQALSSRNAP
jgi:putative addiction module component (TIGR02574 family)